MASALGGRQHALGRNQLASVYVGNLEERVSEGLLFELMVQAGPVVNVHIPRDRLTHSHQGYGFCEFATEADAEYAVKVLAGIKVFGKPVRVSKSAPDRKSLDVGANIFIGNLAPQVDERILFDTFIAFGAIVAGPKVAVEEATGASKGFAFISFDSFAASDAAIEGMNGQFLCNRPVSVDYAFKKDSSGERHGSPAERLLAASTSGPGAKRGIPEAAPPAAPGGMPSGASFAPHGGAMQRPPMPGAPPLFYGGQPPPPMYSNGPPMGMPLGAPMYGLPPAAPYAMPMHHQMPYQVPLQMPYQMPLQMPYQMPPQMPYQAPPQVPPQMQAAWGQPLAAAQNAQQEATGAPGE